jgi:elongation factor P
MDSESFEEKIVPFGIVDDKEKWIAEGMEVSLVYFKDNVIEVSVPSNFVYEIVETEPNAKGNTAQGHTKPATLDSGAIITVPGYLNAGEKVKVDTEKGVYLERANK